MPSQEEIAHQLKLLGIHRKTLKHYIEQQAILGNFTPPYITHGIDETRTQIRRIKSILHGWGAPVADLPDDDEQSTAPPLASTVLAQSDAPANTSRSRKKPDDGLPYDVYLSYHPADRAWVRNTLLRQLEGAGLRVIVDYRDFAIGVPKLVNMERAVDQSRHTLLVMTPEWVDGEWQTFQGLLAQTGNPSGRQAKLLPLMLRPCTPPSRIAILDYLDLTDEFERGEQIDRLLRSLAGQPARDAGSAKSRTSKVEPVQEGTATVDQQSQNQVDGPALRRLLIANFGDSDLRDLCDDLGIDYENLPGQAKSDKARELVAYVTRRGRMAALVSQAHSLRPHADWQSVGVASGPAPAQSGGRVTESVARPDTGAATEQRVDFVIITALEEERDAMLAKLPGYRRLNPTNDDIRTYYKASVEANFAEGEPVTYSIMLTSLLGMGRVQATMATSDAIRRWRPRYILLVGIAGGVEAKGVRLGDVLVSEQIVDYELQKLTADGAQVRWQVHRADPRMLNAVLNFTALEWIKYVSTGRPDPNKPKRHIGPIASGDKVIGFDQVLNGYRDKWPALLGVEMEAAGAATAVFQAPQPPGFFMIRGVSDFADQDKGKADVERWREYACDVAAAYTIGLLKSGPIPSSNL
jgi:nucleoside phosphorylase